MTVMNLDNLEVRVSAKDFALPRIYPSSSGKKCRNQC
jgi:hypothetical protein